MPTYQYSCTECGHFFEAVQSFSDDSLTVCPVCEGRLRKVFNAVGVVFKGSGFYRNDSRTANGGSGASGAGSSGDGGSTSTPPEAAPAAKESTPSPSKSEGAGSSSSQSKSA